MKTKGTIIAALLVCGGQACIGQVITPEVMASAGDSYSTAQVSLSWTMGEPVTATANANNYYLTAGFQQPTNIVVTQLNNPAAPNNTVSVYPNPAKSSVYINRDGDIPLQIQLMDMNGKLIVNELLSSNENQLDMSTLAGGMYLLKVYNTQNQLIQSLKIEKTN